jgi:hypothetical protein
MDVFCHANVSQDLALFVKLAVCIDMKGFQALRSSASGVPVIYLYSRVFLISKRTYLLIILAIVSVPTTEGEPYSLARIHLIKLRLAALKHS